MDIERRVAALEASRRGLGSAVDPRLESAISGALRAVGGFDAQVAILNRIDAGTDTAEDRASLTTIPPCDAYSPNELLRLLVRVHEMF
ncbi:MAG: hypothetical protein OJF60_003399 [Burkholderiaceae bacterium]|jgi:hypothetical protein|nr:MAG: hypothetical protein OJF60_003399 [Burkholderiaceae bacterium]